MTEPSQEAVELAREFGHSPESGHAPHERLSCRFCPAPWPCRYVFYIDSALRAVEQRTRLETILRYGWHVSGCNVWWRGNDTTWPTHDAYLRDPDCDCGLTQALVGSEIASLQPREAPKAEEPKR